MLLYAHMLSFLETPDYDYLHSLLCGVGDLRQLSADEVQIIKHDLSGLSLADCNSPPPCVLKCVPPGHAQYVSPVPR